MVNRFFIKLFLIFFLIPCLAGQFELRGIWMQATQIRDRESAEKIAQRIASAKLNAVFVLVYYWGGKSFFRTDYAPLAQENLKDDDLFYYFVQECHKRGIKVFARFSNGQEGGKGSDGILSLHPDWQIENAKGEKRRWFDLGKKEVRDFQLKLIADLLKDYPVDGVQLDYIRFPSNDYCYCEECRSGFRKIYGVDPLDLLYGIPISLSIHSKPLVKVVTAKVLARFDNGTPAITIKENSSKGWLLFFNWTVDENSFPLFSRTLWRALEGEGTILIPLQRNGLSYDKENFQLMLKLLKEGGYKWGMLGELKQLDPNNLVVLIPGLETIGEDVSKDLEEFVNKGGRVIVTLGRRGIKGSSIEDILGVSGLSDVMRGKHYILPVETHPLIPMFSDNNERRKLIEEWLSYRKALITSFVEEVFRMLKGHSDSLQLSAAVFYNKISADRVLQDWYNWIEEEIVDFLAPMAYVDDGRLLSAIKEWKRYDPELKRIIAGLSIYKVVRGREVSKGKNEVMRQLEILKREGAKGFILFSLPFLTDELVKELAKLG
ncbi:family 10 glycosylhydrolase [bacterium]|nr:family 10 glycosylhydrolase [bacterium]